MKRHITKACMLTLCCVWSIAAVAQSVPNEQNTADSVPVHKETFWDKAKEHFEIHGYAQAGYTYANNGEENSYTNTFDLKRVIMWLDVRFTNWLSFRYMHDFCSAPLEYYVDFKLLKSKALNIRFGQFKNSLSLENPLSPSAVELINVCSQGVSAMAGGPGDPLYGNQTGRDLGLMVFGELFNEHFYYEAAVMNGQGINRKDGNKAKDVLLKLGYRPCKGLQIVASGQKGKGHAVGTASWNPDIKEGDNYRRDRLTIGAEWKPTFISIRGEYLWGQDGNVTSHAAYLTASIPIYKGLEGVISGDYIDHNTKMDYKQTNATVGLQYWVYKKCRVQLQYTHAWRTFAHDYNSLQAQVQVKF